MADLREMGLQRAQADRAEDTPPDPLTASAATQVQTERVGDVANTQENTRADASGTLDPLQR
ncbi:hypothetical protein XB05_10505 [Xanthomonas arboricola]|uniref:hypothetical protein n=1 Tax=Xanthomonas arboricola TaxID=56448 RepID=UPI00061A2653|nr:hypothetical protein [Xanthomonas arboricola]AKC79123.1 hypothetical protein XB05_10505 [Xanthomonas arboricola]